MREKTFKQVVLEFILDGDSVQALMKAADDQGISASEALDVILDCFNSGLAKAYYHHTNLEKDEDVDLSKITIDKMRVIPYIWLEATEKTVTCYNDLLTDSV